MSDARPILVVAEARDGAPGRLTGELLALGTQLKTAIGAPVVAASFADRDPGIAGELIAAGADEVQSVEHPALAHYQGEAWVSAAAQLCRDVKPALVLIGHNALGGDLAPRLAFRLDGAVATGCIGIAWHDGRYAFTRPCYGGNLHETLAFESAVTVATVRAGSVRAAPRDESRGGTVGRFTPVLEDEPQRVRVVERRSEATQAIRLEDAEVIVAGGRGLNGPEGFRALEALAAELGGAVGASRVPCDLGWCPRGWQIGLTGRTVQPDLYIAVGISGAGHHLAGCGNAKTIVAVNTDPDAAIYREARYGVVSDYQQFVPALLDEIRKVKAQHR
ncbi:MAG TPA: electron transfer flavoprotein subunit alpha/FixB family protein [Burkholderiales bacterium]|nr:electron transfer flavoprotein subunit alpha/FixB family protein [Burkholderiales bacterium]